MRLAQRNGDLSAIDEAIQTWQEAVDGTPDRHPTKPGRLSALATTRFMRFQSDPADLSPLDAGIRNLRDALRLSPPGHAQRAMLLTNLGALLLSRFEQTGERDVLDEAVRVSRDATTGAPPEHADRGRHLSNLGVALVHQARISDKPSDSRKAIDVIRQALEVVGPGAGRGPGGVPGSRWYGDRVLEGPHPRRPGRRSAGCHGQRYRGSTKRIRCCRPAYRRSGLGGHETG